MYGLNVMKFPTFKPSRDYETFQINNIDCITKFGIHEYTSTLNINNICTRPYRNINKDDIVRTVDIIQERLPNIDTLILIDCSLEHDIMLYLLDKLITKKVINLKIYKTHLNYGYNYKMINEIISKSNIKFISLHGFEPYQLETILDKLNIVGLEIGNNIVDDRIIDILSQLNLTYLHMHNVYKLSNIDNLLRYNTDLIELSIESIRCNILDIYKSLGDSLEYNMHLLTLSIRCILGDTDYTTQMNKFINNCGILNLCISDSKSAVSPKYFAHRPDALDIVRPFLYLRYTCAVSTYGEIDVNLALKHMNYLIRMIHFVICKKYALPQFVKLYICFNYNIFTELENTALANYFLENVHTKMYQVVAWRQLLLIKTRLRQKNKSVSET